MRWQALGAGIAGAIVSFSLVAFADFSRLGKLATSLPAEIPSMWIHHLDSALRTLGPASLYGVASAVLIGWHPTRRVLRAARMSCLGVFALGSVASVQWTLEKYPPFRTFWPSLLLLALGFVAMVFVSVFVWRDGVRSRLRWVVIAIAVLVSAGLCAADHVVYPGLYLSLHTGFLELAVIALSVGFLTWGIEAPKSALRVLGAAAVLLAATAGVSLAAIRTRNSFALTAVDSSTTLGEARNAFEESERRERGQRITLDAGPEPERYFVEHSGYPKLPEGFSVDDFDVLLITVEATRYDWSSLSRGQYDTTPHLLAFANSGAFWFERAYSASSGTLHSISSLITMAIPSALKLHTTARPWWGTLSEEETTVAEIFARAGRATFWARHDVGRAFSARRIHGFAQGIEPSRLREARGGTSDEKIAAHSRAQIESLRRAQRRYFGWAFFEAPHGEYAAHPPVLASASNEERYRSEMTYADAQIGSLLSYLKDAGALDHTIVIVAADHGEEFGDHGGERHKATLYEEVIHVPFLVRIPGLAGQRVSRPVSISTVFPWLLRTSRGEAREHALRRIANLWVPLMQLTGDAVVGELIGHDRMLASLVYDDGRKVYYNVRSDDPQVFDLRADPRERHNLLPSYDPRAVALLPALENYLNFRATVRRFTADGPKPKKRGR